MFSKMYPFNDRNNGKNRMDTVYAFYIFDIKRVPQKFFVNGPYYLSPKLQLFLNDSTIVSVDFPMFSLTLNFNTPSETF